ncbi:MAG: hypothetical protein J1E34_06825, partial [Oscillospiraceae bacterium]|nr:hypothetical protein [Oscillospiraceae bacterium]
SVDEQVTAYSQVVTVLNTIKEYSDTVINAIIGRDYYNAIVELEQALYTDINQYVRFFVKNTAETLATASTQEMMDAVRAIPENLSGLRAFYDELSASAGQERADVLLGSILQKAETLEEVVLSYLSTRFSEEVLEAERMWIEVANREAIIWNFEVYFKLRSAFNNLEDNILSWLYEIGRDDVVSQEIKDLYDEINRIVYAGYKEFRDSFGFNAFQQTELPYESRYPYDNDVVKTEPYEVTEQKLLDTIKKLDAFLTSDEFNQLVGLEGDLGSTLTGLLEGVIYTDSFINTVVNLLYPLVLGEFAKVFSDLPTEVETDLELMGSKQHLNVKVAYAKLLYEVLEETNLNLTPELLSASLPDTYEAAKTALAKARRDWTNSNIFENGSLTLDWGVNAAFADESLTDDEKVEYFYQAAAAALSGLKPLLMALLANTPWNSSVESIATGKTTVKVLVTVDVTVDVVLNLKATANNGYVNALGPVFEALGIENIPEAATLTAYGAAGDTASVVKAIFEPIFDFVQNVGEQPIDTVLGILPNLVYALSFNMVPNILSMLKTEIAYDADANYNAIGFVTGTVDDVLADSVKIDVGTMLNLESMGLDLSNGLAGIISLLGVDIPALDEATISTLGKLITKTGTVRNEWIYDNSEIGNDSYYTVEADKADVAYYILTYVGDILKDKEALTNLLSAFLDEEKIGTVTNILNVLDINDTGDVIAALVEILNAEPYPEAQFSYENFRGTDGSSIAEIKNAAYTLYWKEWHAKYVGEHLTSLVENVLKLIGNYGEEIDVGAELTKLINSLFTNANMEALTGLVSGLLDGLDESVMNIISTVDPLINFDISAILDAVKNPEIPEFEDGDRDGFINALVAYVTPLVPVLKVLLVGGDNVITVADDLATIYGADGYESGVIPVLEAIGCDPATIVSYDEFAALEGEDAVYAVLNPILTLVDSILDSEVGDMLNKLLGLLPNILYFIESDGLNQAVKNILRPVYVVLDEIRPIKDIELSINLNLNDILAGLLDNVSVSLGGITIVLPSFDELSDLLLSIGTVSTYTSATGAEAKKLSVDNAFTPELVTYILRLLVGAILFENNTNAAIRWVQQRDILSDGQKTDLINIIKALSKLSTDQAMFILFNIFFGANLAFEGVENATNTADYIESLLQSISDNFENGIESQYESLVSALEAIAKSSSEQFQNFVDRAEETIASIKEGAQNFRDNVSNQAGQAANGVQNSLLNFINGIKDFFQRLANIFRNLFSNLTK